MKKSKGITLIALVVTIVVLLILAGVSIGMLTGENGIIKQAQNAKDKNKAEAIREIIKLWNSEQKLNDYTGNTSTGTVIDKIYQEGLITEEEKNQLAIGESIQIGDEEISLAPTIGGVYTEEMIGTSINYTSNTDLPDDTEWIVLGKDEDGSIMLTTSRPIENVFDFYLTVDAWLSYEKDLDSACSVYGANIQGKEIKARSMNLKDVNRVTGFIEPIFNTYTFGTEYDYDNKKIDFWHPDENGNATEDDGEGNPNLWSKREKKYECNTYFYYVDNDDTIKYIYEGNDWDESYAEEYTKSELKNIDLILGEGLNYDYLLASKSVRVTSDEAYFIATLVLNDGIGSFGSGMCQGYSDYFDQYYGNPKMSIRPIINVPASIEVEKLNGKWCIAY